MFWIKKKPTPIVTPCPVPAQLQWFAEQLLKKTNSWLGSALEQAFFSFRERCLCASDLMLRDAQIMDLAGEIVDLKGEISQVIERNAVLTATLARLL